MQIKIKKLNKNAVIPTKGSNGAAGYDLYALTSKMMQIISPGSTVKISTGISLEIPDGYFGAVFARSSLATKRGLRLANSVGVIDSDYRGELIVALHNDSDDNVVIKQGDRIAQLVIIPYQSINFIETVLLEDTERGSGGFGSTGV